MFPKWMRKRKSAPSPHPPNRHNEPASLRMVSTAEKDMDYCQQLHALRNNRAFLQELNERRTMLMLDAVQLDIGKPQLRGELGKIEGQIICLDWILLELVNMQPKEAPNEGPLIDEY